MSAARIACVFAAFMALGSSAVGAPLGKAAVSVRRTQQADAAAKQESEIASVLGRYVAAMEAKDMAGLKALWPALGESQEQKVGATFGMSRSIRVQLQVIDVQIDGSTAVASCQRRDHIVTMEGLSFQSGRKATVRLTGKAGAWFIASIE